MDGLDISRNRAARKYPLRVQLMRIAWGGGKVLFRLSPRPCYGLRRGLLRLFGAKVGRSVNVSNSAVIYFPWNLEIGDWSAIGEHAYIYNLGNVSIGEKATVSQRAHLCAGTHDYTDPELPLLTPEIRVGGQSWICADVFVGPGVEIGEGAVAAARSVVVKNIPSWSVAAGNPARVLKKREMKSGPKS